MVIPQNPTLGSTAPVAIEPIPPPASISCRDLDNLDAYLTEKIPELEKPSLGALPLTISDKKSTVQLSLQRKKGYFIVPCNGAFHYFRLGDIMPKGNYLYEIVGKQIPVLREGFVVIDKEVYFVSVDDIQRSVIRKSRKLRLKRGTITYDDFLSGSACISDPNPTSSAEKSGSGGNGLDAPSVQQSGTQSSSETRGEEVPDSTISDILKGNVKRRPSKATKLDESEAIDLAFQDQMRALLSDVSEKEGTSWEGWEVAEAP